MRHLLLLSDAWTIVYFFQVWRSKRCNILRWFFFYEVRFYTIFIQYFYWAHHSVIPLQVHNCCFTHAYIIYFKYVDISGKCWNKIWISSNFVQFFAQFPVENKIIYNLIFWSNKIRFHFATKTPKFLHVKSKFVEVALQTYLKAVLFHC